MATPVFGSLVPLVGRVNTSVLAINQVRWFTWSLFYQEYVEQGYADIHDPSEPGVVVALKIDGTAATYSALPTTGLVPGMVYVAGDTGRAYVWSGSSWPAANAGIAIQGPRGYTGNGIESVTVSGNSLVFHMTDGNALPPIYLQVLADLQGAAEQAGDARDQAVAAATHITEIVVPQIEDYAGQVAADAAQVRTDREDTEDARSDAQSRAEAAGQAAGDAAADRQAVVELRNEVIGARDVTTGARDATLAAVEDIDAAMSHVDLAKDEVLEAATIAAGAAELADRKADAAGISAAAAQQAAEQATEVIPPASETEFGKIKLRGDLGGTADAPTVPGLATKRDTISGANRAYTNDGNGNPSSLPYSSGTAPSSIMFRDSAGRTKVASPSAATDAANKDYVDTGLGGKVDTGQARSIATAAIAEWVDGTPAALDTLQELAAALGNDPNFATTVMNLIGQKAALSHWHTVADITNASILGRVLMAAATQADARTAIGAASQVNMTALEQTLDAYFIALNLRNAGVWSPTATYDVGQVVSYNHSRYYCREGHGPVATFPEDKYVRTGSDIVFATSDPGGGQVWVKI